MKFILFVAIFGNNANISSGLALTSQQIIFNNSKQCEIAKQEILNFKHVVAKTGLGSDIGNFVVKAICVYQGA